MKSRLHKIEIKNFKAFRNGAGKSSLYWALYTFLQSARKPKNSIAKYFTPDGPENLLNLHETDPVAKPGEIALTLRERAREIGTTEADFYSDFFGVCLHGFNFSRAELPFDAKHDANLFRSRQHYSRNKFA